MGEWIMETSIGDYIGTTKGIHFPTKHQTDNGLRRLGASGSCKFWKFGFVGGGSRLSASALEA